MPDETRVAEGRVIVVDYDARWPIQYEEEKSRVLEVIGRQVVSIEHFGSTAVPDLGAKPTIDILVGLRRLDDASACIEPLATIDYEYVPEYEKAIPDRRYFHKGPVLQRTFHLHMVEFGGSLWARHLLFRDYLRAHPDEAAKYNALKRGLADRFGANREGYTDAKAEFVRAIQAKARGDCVMGS